VIYTAIRSQGCHGAAGPGAFDFKQGDTKGGFFWRAVGQFLANPNQAQIACQAPKPILLDTGEATLPYAWCAAHF